MSWCEEAVELPSIEGGASCSIDGTDKKMGAWSARQTAWLDLSGRRMDAFVEL